LLKDAKSPAVAGHFEEQLKGLEPSTFCMASLPELADWLWNAESQVAETQLESQNHDTLVR